MVSDPSHTVSNKRKRSDTEDDAERERTSSLIRRSIALVTAIPEIPTASLHPVLNTLTEACGSALLDEARNSKSVTEEEDWDWEFSPEQIARLSEEELRIWKDLLPCRNALAITGIKLHPLNWKMPVLDLRQWQAHIPGRKGTPWEGGVYSLDVTFPHDLPEGIPKCRFFRPLLHPNVYVSGTWGFIFLPEVTLSSGKNSTEVWLKTKQEDPMLRSIRKIMHEPIIDNPAQAEGYSLLKDDPEGYEEKIREQAKAWTPDPNTGLAGRPILKTSKYFYNSS
ncbi:SUMO-conjugating enzyme ubc9 [Favolaschia claudopus]|uniref:SUMO-conjugating enzyme ubc9 n=1 Tax=Favolaschia claudopus TaxID=2862362 RepID=A0AAW0D1S4_9AGAR